MTQSTGEVRWSPDGTRVFARDGRGATHIYDARDGSKLVSLANEPVLSESDWSPDSSRILSYSAQSAYVWDARTGTKLTTLVHPGRVRSVQWSPDGTRVLSSADAGDTSAVRVWDARTGRELGVLPDTSLVPSRAWDSTGNRFLTTSKKGGVRIVDANSRLPLSSLGSESEPSPHLAEWSPAGSLVVTASHDAVRIWDADTGRESSRLEGDSAGANQVAWSPDGQRILATWKEQGVVRVWDVSSGGLVSTLETSGPLGSAGWASGRGGLRILTESSIFASGVQVWEPTSGQNLLRIADQNGARWSPSGDGLLMWSEGVVTPWENTVRVYTTRPAFDNQSRDVTPASVGK